MYIHNIQALIFEYTCTYIYLSFQCKNYLVLAVSDVTAGLGCGQIRVAFIYDVYSTNSQTI